MLRFHRHRRDKGRTNRRVATFNRLLDILRNEVATAQNDQIFDSSGNVDLIEIDEAEVPGAQEGAIAVCEQRAKRLPGGVGLVPVALGDARTCQPDLPNLSFIT